MLSLILTLWALCGITSIVILLVGCYIEKEAVTVGDFLMLVLICLFCGPFALGSCILEFVKVIFSSDCFKRFLDTDLNPSSRKQNRD